MPPASSPNPTDLGFMPAVRSDAELQRNLSTGQYDFVDFGCSHGGSFELAERMFGDGGRLRGLGLDIDPDKVAVARKAGRDALVQDLTAYPARHDTTRFVMMAHILEHLPGLKAAEQVMRAATRTARDFTFVAQPWFDSDGYLFERGLKLFWSDWHGHPNRMTTLDFHYILQEQLRRGEISGFSLFGADRIRTSRHSAVHALGSPRNQSAFTTDIHPPKPRLPAVFTRPVFREIHAVVDIRDRAGLAAYRTARKDTKLIYQSYSS